MSEHSLLAPSSAHRWMTCPASLLLESGLPDSASEYAAEGTVAHAVAAKCLEEGLEAKSQLGYKIEADGYSFRVNVDMAAAVQIYLDDIRAAAEGNDLLIEQKVDFSTWVGVPNQRGTADAVIISADGTELQVRDLKFGRGVQVMAENNEQLMLYALGAYEQYGMLGDFERIKLGIHQPRLKHLDEWEVSVADLLAFAERAKGAATKAVDILETKVYGYEDLVPGESQCRFCKAKATCPALRAKVELEVGSHIEDLTAVPDVSQVAEDGLASAMAAADLIEGWVKAVRAETERRLLEGLPVAGFKIVQGRKGHRAWSDPDAAEQLLKSMRVKLEDMYDLKLISPTSAEKLAPKFDKDGKLVPPKEGAAPPVIGPRQWPKVKALITQPDGKPSVAPVSDPRPAIVLRSADDFTDLNTQENAGADLV